MENLRQVLHIIQENGLKSLKSEKCVFMAGNFIYLGFKINKNGVLQLRKKRKHKKSKRAILIELVLRTFKATVILKTCFRTLEPLHELFRNGVKWEWEQKQKAALEKAKSIIYESSLLI